MYATCSLYVLMQMLHYWLSDANKYVFWNIFTKDLTNPTGDCEILVHQALAICTKIFIVFIVQIQLLC